jgi:cytochrome P450
MSNTAEVPAFPCPSTANGLPNGLLQGLTRDNPVIRVVGPAGKGAWLVSGDKEARTVLSDTDRFTSEPDLSLDDRGSLAASMAVTDPPDHTRLRKLASKVFTTRRINGMVPSIERLAHSLLDDMQRSGPPADLVDSFALPFPMAVICQMLGVPQEDASDLVQWSSYLTSLTEYTPEEIGRGLAKLHTYMGALIARRRSELGEDVLSALIRARDEQEALSEAELIAMAASLVTGGHKSPVSAITRGIMALTTSGEWDRLVTGEVTPQQVTEEVLRHQSPIDTAAWRTATVDTELAGVAIQAGEAVYVSLHLANHDDNSRQQPHVFDAGRRDEPGHLSFGHGIHFCLGAGLARAELTIAFAELAARFPHLRLDVSAEELDWTRGHLMNRPIALPVTW